MRPHARVEHRAVGSGLDPFAVGLAARPRPHVPVARRPGEGAFAVHFARLKGAGVRPHGRLAVGFGPLRGAEAVRHAKPQLALVRAAEHRPVVVGRR